MRTGTSGIWRMRKEPTALRMSSDMLAISAACRCPFLCGSPEATIYASPIVSTWGMGLCLFTSEHPAPNTQINDTCQEVLNRLGQKFREAELGVGAVFGPEGRDWGQEG